MRVLPLSHMPRLDEATSKGSHNAAFDSTTLTGAFLPMHAEPPLVIDLEDCEGVLSGPSRSNLSHHLRTAQSMEVERAATPMRMLGGPILLYFDPRFSVSQTDPQRALNTSKVKSKCKCNSSWPSLVTRLLHKCKSSPWKVIYKSTAK